MTKRFWSLDRVATLVVRPERFFPEVLRLRGEELPLLGIWALGVAAAIDRIDLQLLTGRMAANSAALSSWPKVWAFVLGTGIVSGPLIWLFGGWWFRMRLLMSGARDVDKRHARLVYLYASLVVAIHGIAWLALVTLFYPSYHAAYTDSPLAVTLLAIVWWSFWVSYRGVRQCFEVKPGAARIWFLILPLAFSGTVAIAAAAVSMLGPF